MDSALATALNASLTSIKDASIVVLIDNAPIALGGLVTISALFFGIKAFRAILFGSGGIDQSSARDAMTKGFFNQKL